MEIAGELDEFVKAVGRVPGLEFLAEELEEKVEADEFAAVDKDGNRHAYQRQLFLVATDYTAWQQLLSLWERFQRGEQFPYGLTKFQHLFGRLRELRPWDDRDRLERSGAVEVWSRELEDLDDELVEFEAELWLRRDETRRISAVTDFKADLKAAGGSFVTESVHGEIGYHGVLGRVPAHLLRSAAEHREVQWLRTGSVRFFHATGQMAAVVPQEEEISRAVAPQAEVGGQPRIALLDGVPLSSHETLAGRILLDDPEGWEAVAPVDRRVHGTGMASLILHGDLSEQGKTLRAPIYVRPILKADAPSWVSGDVREELPRDRLPVDVVQEAVARLFEEEAVAPEVRVIVLAVGDAVQQFDRFISPLARLLDWVASRYGVLVVVSAGNHLADIVLPGDVDLSDPDELQHEILCALQREGSMRRLLSPGESVNAITVGAAHGDASEEVAGPGSLEVILTPDLANTASAVGFGARRSVKPDVLFPGGRQTLQVEPESPGDPHRLSAVASRRAPGVKMATVGVAAGDLSAASFGIGTSVATGLAGNLAGQLLEQLDELREVYGEDLAGPEFDAVLLKAALVHRASWGAAHALIDGCQEDLGRGRTRAAVARMIGYGNAGATPSLVCDDHRATAVGAGRLVDGKADVFRLPLPPSLSSQATRRRVAITLAWMTPINTEHRHYRRAALNVDTNGFPNFLGSRFNLDKHSARRGTLQHEVFESDRASPFADGSAVELIVSCRADAGDLAVEVPYALMTTVEVAEGIDMPIYEEIREGLHVPVQVRARAV